MTTQVLQFVALFDAARKETGCLGKLAKGDEVDRLVDARWTDEIHDEWIRNLAANVPAIAIERLQITPGLMHQALPNALVSSYNGRIAGSPCRI